MSRNPVLLIHGYSDEGSTFKKWEQALALKGYDVTTIHTCSYQTLTNEVTIRDIAEGLDRAIRIRSGLNNGEPFDAIVHSTGMLVIRAWLANYEGRRERLKHLIGLAPASFGSPLAHKGRSWLGALFKGNKTVGPDFLEAGDYVLDGLELGSRFTWDLADMDLLGTQPFYGPTGSTPYVFIFCGNKTYSGIRSFVNEPGTDGTVRWAGCALNARKITLDLTQDPSRPDSKDRITIAEWSNVNIPLIPVDGVNHGTILSNPGQDLIDLVDSAMQVSTEQEFNQWHEQTAQKAAATLSGMREWQQFIVRAVDERGDPIPDYNIQLFTKDARKRGRELKGFDMDVHVYSNDHSLRCFHVDLAQLKRTQLDNLWLHVIASSGSQLVGYHGYGSEKTSADHISVNRDGKWDAELDLSPLLDNPDVKFFYPFTTTLAELRLNREPLPLSGENKICWF